MKIKVPEAEILRTPIKIEKLSLWNRSRSGFIMNFEFHRFLKKTLFSRKVMNFKCVYSNQFKRFKNIQGISEMQNSMKNTMTKLFLARAHFRARAGRILCLLKQNLMIFESLQQDEVWRAPRAHPKFFY